MSLWRNSPLPKEVTINQSAVPLFTSAGGPTIVVTSVLTDIQSITFTNTTSAAISATVTDGNDIQIANISSYPINPNTPYHLDFLPMVRAVSGVKIYATSVGLKFNIQGWKHASFTDRSA